MVSSWLWTNQCQIVRHTLSTWWDQISWLSNITSRCVFLLTHPRKSSITNHHTGGAVEAADLILNLDFLRFSCMLSITIHWDRAFISSCNIASSHAQLWETPQNKLNMLLLLTSACKQAWLNKYLYVSYILWCYFYLQRRIRLLEGNHD